MTNKNTDDDVFMDDDAMKDIFKEIYKEHVADMPAEARAHETGVYLFDGLTVYADGTTTQD